MRRLLAALFLLVCFAPLALAQKTRFGQAPSPAPDPANYSLKVHITASQLRTSCSGESGFGTGVICGYGLFVEAQLNGKNIELWGSSVFGKQTNVLLTPGDYPAYLKTDKQVAGGAGINQIYELLLPDKTVWTATLSRIAE